MITLTARILLILTISCACSSASGQQNKASFDVEIDPIAYLLSGHSLHIGLRYSRFRLDFGNFALRAPEAFHENSNFSLQFSGFGIKLDYFPLQKYPGIFIGAQSAQLRSTIQHTSGTASHNLHYSFGTRIGYQYNFDNGLYISPWIGIDYTTGSDISIEKNVFHHKSITLFPTIHIGFRL